MSDLIQARSHGNVVEPPSVDPRITQESFILNFGLKNWSLDIILLAQKWKRKKLENTVASLLEDAASGKNQVAEEIKEIRSSVAMVKTGLGAQIDRIAVSNYV